MKVGIIGSGFMARTHAEAYRQMSDVEIAGISSTNPVTGSKFAEEFGCPYYPQVEVMLACDDIQIIDICVPTDVHEKYVVMAAAAGKHVLCEKPMAITLEAADRMIAATEQAGVKFMIAQVLRFWPEYVKIKELYEAGSLGEINMVYANRLAQHPTWSEWFADVTKSGGGLFDLHLHDIDYVRHLLGPVKSVYAVGKKFSNGAWNHVMTSLSFHNGSKASVEGSYHMPNGYPFTMSLRATSDRSGIDFHLSAGFNLENLNESQSRLLFFDEGQDLKSVEFVNGDPYFNELRYFVDCVASDEQPKIMMPRESREVLEIVLAIEQSLETGEIQYIR